MPEGEHDHHRKYMTRIVTSGVANPHLPVHGEFLQFICELDGIIFKEIKITRENAK